MVKKGKKPWLLQKTKKKEKKIGLLLAKPKRIK